MSRERAANKLQDYNELRDYNDEPTSRKITTTSREQATNEPQDHNANEPQDHDATSCEQAARSQQAANKIMTRQAAN